MMNKKLTVFLIDDELPNNDEFIMNGVYDNAISSDDLYHLAISEDWKSLHFLQDLVKNIVSSTPCNNGLIKLLGFKSPSIALSAIEDGIKPDIIIYDWEYGISNPVESQNWLQEILSLTEAFVFVYSKVRNEIPPFLNKSVFTPYAERLQLFYKGSNNHSIFSSEEFIFQYIVGKVSDTIKIKIQGFDVEFTSNSFLKKASDILYLERILGRGYILDELKKIQFELNKYTVENLLKEFNGHIFYNEAKGLLISPDDKTMVEKYSPLREMEYFEVVKLSSIQKLEEVLERGVALVK